MSASQCAALERLSKLMKVRFTISIAIWQNAMPNTSIQRRISGLKRWRMYKIYAKAYTEQKIYVEAYIYGQHH